MADEIVQRSSPLKETRSTIKCMPPRCIFNLPLFETYMVVDCRSTELYNKSHLASALSFPYLPSSNSTEKEKEENLANFATNMLAMYCHERWDPIVLYAGSSDDVLSNSHMNWFAEKVNLVVLAASKPEGISKFSDDSEFSFLFKRFMEYTRNIWIIQGGYDSFQREYLPLCVMNPSETMMEKDPTGAMSMIPLPYHVVAAGNGVFVSSRAVTWSNTLFKEFQVKAVVLDEKSYSKISPLLTDSGVEAFICSVPDGDQDGIQNWDTPLMMEFFDRSTTFIQEKIDAQERVVVQLHGRSHSAGIVIAWYMRFHTMSFDQAKREVQKTTPSQCSSRTSVLDNDLLFEKDLRLWNGGRTKRISMCV